jgi:hypothetical protein
LLLLLLFFCVLFLLMHFFLCLLSAVLNFFTFCSFLCFPPHCIPSFSSSLPTLASSVHNLISFPLFHLFYFISFSFSFFVYPPFVPSITHPYFTLRKPFPLNPFLYFFPSPFFLSSYLSAYYRFSLLLLFFTSPIIPLLCSFSLHFPPLLPSFSFALYCSPFLISLLSFLLIISLFSLLS